MSKAKQAAQVVAKQTANVVETFKDIGVSAGNSFKDDVLKQTTHEFVEQLFGIETSPVISSGEIAPGQSVEISSVAVEKSKEKKDSKKTTFERHLLVEEEARVERKTNELRMQLEVLTSEVINLATQTQSLAQETRIAAVQAPVEPGVYHVIFFEKLISFIRSFRKKIEDAAIWLQASNKRAQKKGWVSNYKKGGAQYLLSNEHYLSRSAG